MQNKQFSTFATLPDTQQKKYKNVKAMKHTKTHKHHTTNHPQTKHAIKHQNNQKPPFCMFKYSFQYFGIFCNLHPFLRKNCGLLKTL